MIFVAKHLGEYMIKKVEVQAVITTEGAHGLVNAEAHWECPYCNCTNVQYHGYSRSSHRPGSYRVSREQCFMCGKTVDLWVMEPDNL